MMNFTTTQTLGINADFGRQAMTALFAACFIGNNVSMSDDIAKGDADKVINKGFALAERIMKLRGY